MPEPEPEGIFEAYDELEAEAEGLLRAGRDGDGEGLDERATRLIRRLRGQLREHRTAIERTRSETRTQVIAELVRERKVEANYRRVNAPQGARPLFSDVDETDEQAMRARALQLREAGITWPDQPAPPPQAPEPDLAAVNLMQAAGMGASTPEGGWQRDLERAAQDPDAVDDATVERLTRKYNEAVDAAARHSSAGALG